MVLPHILKPIYTVDIANNGWLMLQIIFCCSNNKLDYTVLPPHGSDITDKDG